MSDALSGLLPPLDGLPPELIAELEQLETQTNEELRQFLYEFVSSEQQEALEDLLYKNREGSLTAEEYRELIALQEAADKIMLRKARAAVILRFRGQPLPTLAELQRQSRASGKPAKIK